MKTYKIISALFILLTFTNYSVAQCGPTDVDPTPQVLGFCEGVTDTVSFEASGTCSGNYEYQVETSTNIVIQPWSTNDEFITTPDSTDTYNILARCSACPANIVEDTFLIEVVQAPTITADTFVCHGTEANLVGSNIPDSIMSWWDSPTTAGNELSTTESYTTPPMTSDDTFYIHVSGNVVENGVVSGSVLITEVGLEGFAGGGQGDQDYLEISNLFGNTINTTGWTAAISDSYSNINSVNSTVWNLPNSFAPCSILSKTDVNGSANYWGSNIFWNPNQPGWAMIIDDVGNLVDFVAWGWTAAQLATLNVNVNGFNITLGSEWTGNGCSSACSAVGVTQYSLSRIGNADNNDAGDFVCQATSLNVVNPSLNCGWTTSNITCPYPVEIEIDLLPTASVPDTTFVSCYSDIPVEDPLIIDDEADDYTVPPTVQFMGEVTDGNLCPEIITRTYRISDSCSNYTEVDHIIVVEDTVAPIVDTAPSDTTVSCYADVPVMNDLDWTDNCMGVGSVQGVETTDGNNCPEVLTRTWTVSDTCGNTVTQTQEITIHDTIAPVIDPAPDGLTVQCYDNVPPMDTLNWTDNCDGNDVLYGDEVSDGQTCPETFTRTWTYTDGCDNTSTETQVIVVNDDIAPTADPLPSLQLSELPPADTNILTNVYDNCGTPTLVWEGDDSDGGFCPENVTRTYSLTDGCGNVTFISQDFIIGDGIPNVDFDADPMTFDNLSSGEVEFFNNTTGATTYTWNFGDYSPTSNEENPTHVFYVDSSSSVTYEVYLVATSEFGCSDSTMVPIQVINEQLYYVPNSFTPDGDPFNQTFKPIFATGFDTQDYNLLIFNRWGEVLFESNNHNVGWDGTYGGKMVENGTYVYKIEFGLESDDARKTVTGHVTLIR
ncbi:MAG: T9SS type B sorting domain-containing protein [Brumimicrobium sp.]